MAAFIYAIPGTGLASESKIKKAGLEGLFGPESPSQRPITTGPGGKSCILVSTIKPKQLLFKPGEQNWAESLSGKYQVGFYVNEPPGPGDLARPTQLAGHEVELGDGNKWLVPVCRIIPGGSTLPKTLLLGKDGEVMTEDLPKYAEFSAMVERLWADFLGETGKDEKDYQSEMPVTERMQLAIKALGWNYRVTADEVNALKLITTQHLYQVLNAIIDLPTLVEVIKKNSRPDTDDSPHTGSGEPD